MPYFSQTIVLGVVGKDAEIRATASGKRVLSFSLAHTEKWSDAGGSPQERTTWYAVSKWEPKDWMVDAIKRGSHVQVIGKVSARAYKANNGEWKASLELRADTVLPLERKAPAAQPEPSDDIPF